MLDIAGFKSFHGSNPKLILLLRKSITYNKMWKCETRKIFPYFFSYTFVKYKGQKCLVLSLSTMSNKGKKLQNFPLMRVFYLPRIKCSSVQLLSSDYGCWYCLQPCISQFFLWLSRITIKTMQKMCGKQQDFIKTITLYNDTQTIK